ncbi:DUF5659 domain-containing protein [Siminovitchia fortis]|uniref:DUF5659 domain-containing protein n=1 Tax=Siminovitchia fortis TaxID=254758 RepID=UPI0016423944|nr:DUF5659 domain-containing protein [Siminovitchia fortis]
MKCILSYRVAKHLLSKGFKIVDIDTSHKIPGNIVFIFERSEELNRELAEIKRKGE